MNIRPSAAIRQNYNEIADLCRKTSEPIFLTKNGEGDIVLMSVDAFENREQVLQHRAAILEAEFSRLNGEPTYTVDEIRRKLKEKYDNA